MNTISQMFWHQSDRQMGILKSVRGVIVIVVGNGHGDTSSNPG